MVDEAKYMQLVPQRKLVLLKIPSKATPFDWYGMEILKGKTLQ